MNCVDERDWGESQLAQTCSESTYQPATHLAVEVINIERDLEH